MFVTSTPSPPIASGTSPSAAAIPRYAAAGIVVTEIATPDAGACARLEREHAGDAREERDSDGLPPDRVEAVQERVVDREVVRQHTERVLQRGGYRCREPGGRHPGAQGDERPAEQPGVMGHDGDARGGDRQQVWAHRHGADDEDRAGVEHAVARDDARDDHQRQVPPHEPGIRAREADDVRPDESRIGVARHAETDLLHAGQHDVGRLDAEAVRRASIGSTASWRASARMTALPFRAAAVSTTCRTPSRPSRDRAAFAMRPASPKTLTSITVRPPSVAGRARAPASRRTPWHARPWHARTRSGRGRAPCSR